MLYFLEQQWTNAIVDNVLEDLVESYINGWRQDEPPWPLGMAVEALIGRNDLAVLRTELDSAVNINVRVGNIVDMKLEAQTDDEPGSFDLDDRWATLTDSRMGSNEMVDLLLEELAHFALRNRAGEALAKVDNNRYCSKCPADVANYRLEAILGCNAWVHFSRAYRRYRRKIQTEGHIGT